MLVFLTKEKALNLKHAAVDLLHCKNPTIGDVARVLGLIVSSFQGVAYGPLHFRYRAPVAQLVENRAAMQEVVSSTPAGPTLRVFK